MKKKNLFIISIILISVLYLMVGCGGGSGGSDLPSGQTSNTIQGVVTDGDTPIEGVTVTLVELSMEDVTDDQGTYSFHDIDDGTYQLKFYKEGVEVTSRSVIAAGGSTYTENVDISDPLTYSDVEELVNDITNYGIYLEETYAEQLTKLEEDFMAIKPYGDPLSEELLYTLRLADSFFSIEPDWYGNPGDYIMDDGEIVPAPSGDDSDDTWKLSLTDNYQEDTNEFIEIQIMNRSELIGTEIIDGVEYTVYDFTKANFSYNHVVEDGEGNVVYSASLTLGYNEQSSAPEEIIYDGSLEKHIVPVDFILALTGDIYSEKTYSELPEGLGIVSIDGSVDIDVVTTDQRHLYFVGSLESDVLSLEGEFNIDLSNTTFTEMMDERVVPIPTRFELVGAFTTKSASMEGSLVINNLDNITDANDSNFKDIKFTGSYRSIDDPDTEKDESVCFADGELFIVPNYINDEIDSATATYEGVLSGNDFEPLDILCELSNGAGDDGENVVMSIRLEYGTDKYLSGTFDYSEVSLTVDLFNEKGLNIDIDIPDRDNYNDSKVGNIYDSEGNLLAEIVVTDYHWFVNEKDGDSTSLFY